jgi:hypothetical protein
MQCISSCPLNTYSGAIGSEEEKKCIINNCKDRYPNYVDNGIGAGGLCWVSESDECYKYDGRCYNECPTHTTINFEEDKKTGDCVIVKCDNRSPDEGEESSSLESSKTCWMSETDECYFYNEKCYSTCPVNTEPEYDSLSGKKTGRCGETECSMRNANVDGCGERCFRYIIKIIFCREQE